MEIAQNNKLVLLFNLQKILINFDENKVSDVIYFIINLKDEEFELKKLILIEIVEFCEKISTKSVAFDILEQINYYIGNLGSPLSELRSQVADALIRAYIKLGNLKKAFEILNKFLAPRTRYLARYLSLVDDNNFLKTVKDQVEEIPDPYYRSTCKLLLMEIYSRFDLKLAQDQLEKEAEFLNTRFCLFHFCLFQVSFQMPKKRILINR